MTAVSEHVLLAADPRFNGRGAAICSCGAHSAWLYSAAARKRWHKQHVSTSELVTKDMT